jgi:phosphomevalonate kinase
MKRRIIAIAGKMRSGKDTFAQWLLEAAGPGWKRRGFADALKQEVAERAALTVEEIEQNKDQWRPELIRWGQYRREQDPLYWVKRVLAEPDNLVIPDLRFPNEMDTLRAEGALFIRVEAIADIRERRGAIINDWTSESQLDHIQLSKDGWDWFIYNNGSLKSYQAQAKKLIPEILKVVKY